MVFVVQVFDKPDPWDISVLFSDNGEFFVLPFAPLLPPTAVDLVKLVTSALCFVCIS